YVKRFRIETRTTGKRFSYLNESKGSKLISVTTQEEPIAEVKYQKDKKSDKVTETLSLNIFIDVKGWKATGNKLNYFKIHNIQILKKPEEEVAPGPAAKQVKKVPKPIPVALPKEVEISVDGATIPLEISTIDSTEDKPVKAKKQLNLF
ncbi:MAG: DNA gyrase/topoisomerase IV subunit A, partial [Adhaeribacter sp.]